MTGRRSGHRPGLYSVMRNNNLITLKSIFVGSKLTTKQNHAVVRAAERQPGGRSMARPAYYTICPIVPTVVYLVVLTVVLVHLLVYPARWEEECLSVGLLTALHVRELMVTARALWRTGQRWRQH